jgi:hypothetical protein
MEQRSRWRRISVSCASVYRVEIRRYVEVLSAREAQLRDNAAECIPWAEATRTSEHFFHRLGSKMAYAPGHAAPQR